ncbi:hypothetical protein ACFSRY_18965 [Pontibacter locisalis]|uniref:Uncharacterized protein n=1 Tax=Pontibacter locisalis TaxID=1719035 RepID=A0ABW5IS97_9BACT
MFFLTTNENTADAVANGKRLEREVQTAERGNGIDRFMAKKAS